MKCGTSEVLEIRRLFIIFIKKGERIGVVPVVDAMDWNLVPHSVNPNVISGNAASGPQAALASLRGAGLRLAGARAAVYRAADLLPNWRRVPMMLWPSILTGPKGLRL